VGAGLVVVATVSTDRVVCPCDVVVNAACDLGCESRLVITAAGRACDRPLQPIAITSVTTSTMMLSSAAAVRRLVTMRTCPAWVDFDEEGSQRLLATPSGGRGRMFEFLAVRSCCSVDAAATDGMGSANR
jgi:hypothetical protein